MSHTLNILTSHTPLDRKPVGFFILRERRITSCADRSTASGREGHARWESTQAKEHEGRDESHPDGESWGNSALSQIVVNEVRFRYTMHDEKRVNNGGRRGLKHNIHMIMPSGLYPAALILLLVSRVPSLKWLTIRTTNTLCEAVQCSKAIEMVRGPPYLSGIDVK